LPSLFAKSVSKYSCKGTDLGFFVSKSIVEAHGGQIWCRNNEEGKEATFAFCLAI